MSSQQALLARVVGELRRLAIPYMVTGSTASSLHGEPRSTHDIDIIVELGSAGVGPLVAAFPEPAFYLEEIAVKDAIARRANFNLIDNESGDKADFWILKDEPFDRERFARRQKARLGDFEFDVSTPEDTILRKLAWSAECGGSDQQFRDAQGIVRVQRQRLDQAYIERWALRLGVSDLWDTVREAVSKRR